MKREHDKRAAEEVVAAVVTAADTAVAEEADIPAAVMAVADMEEIAVAADMAVVAVAGTVAATVTGIATVVTVAVAVAGTATTIIDSYLSHVGDRIGFTFATLAMRERR